MSAGFFIELGVRFLLVALFLPFSALDKIIDFRGAVSQAKPKVPSETLAAALILAAIGVEIIMALGVVTGIADRLAAFLLSGYCVMTALMTARQFFAHPLASSEPYVAFHPRSSHDSVVATATTAAHSLLAPMDR